MCVLISTNFGFRLQFSRATNLFIYSHPTLGVLHINKQTNIMKKKQSQMR